MHILVYTSWCILSWMLIRNNSSSSSGRSNSSKNGRCKCNHGRFYKQGKHTFHQHDGKHDPETENTGLLHCQVYLPSCLQSRQTRKRLILQCQKYHCEFWIYIDSFGNMNEIFDVLLYLRIKQWFFSVQSAGPENI